jgi:hypothetical protein
MEGLPVVYASKWTEIAGTSTGTWTGADDGSGCAEDVTEVDFWVRKSLRSIGSIHKSSRVWVEVELKNVHNFGILSPRT